MQFSGPEALEGRQDWGFVNEVWGAFLQHLQHSMS